MNFIPTPQQEAWIRGKVESGDYANASEVLREAIREKMERERMREAKLRDLRAAIAEGEASGDPVPLDIEKIITKGERDQLRAAKLRDLKTAIEEGMNSGECVPLDMENIKRRARARWEAEHDGEQS